MEVFSTDMELGLNGDQYASSSISHIDLNQNIDTSESLEIVNISVEDQQAFDETNIDNDDDEPDYDEEPDYDFTGDTFLDPINEEYWSKLEFSSVYDCRSYYASYAHKVGFSIRSNYNKEHRRLKIPAYINICCSKEGKPGKNAPAKVDKRSEKVAEKVLKKGDRRVTAKVVPKRRQIRQRRVIRTECKAHIYFRYNVKKGVFMIVRWEVDHNHELHLKSNSNLLRSNRGIDEAQSVLASSIEKAGIPLRSSYELMGICAGGKDFLGFLKQDLKNHLSRRRQKVMKPFEGTLLMEHFRDEQSRCPLFFYNVEMDCDQKIANIFWADARMRLDYSIFGDVLTFDTTFRTNSSNRPLAVFVGLNHHRKTTIFGAALLYDETKDSFIWLFNTFMKCMYNKAPLTILTNQDSAMAAGIKVVFPTTFHGLCTWHLFQNGMQRLGGKFKVVRDHLNDLMYSVESEEDFEKLWLLMIDCSCSCQSSQVHPWLERIYNKRQQWSSVWMRQNFTAGMRSTQLSESFNAAFKSSLASPMDIDKFFNHFNKVVDDKRREELKLDFDMIEYMPLNDFEASPIVCVAASFYTHNVFQYFQEQFRMMFSYILDPLERMNVSYERHYEVFKKIEGVKIDIRHVVVDTERELLKCSCLLFESFGILCCHILRVMDVLCSTTSYDMMATIPEKYLLQRWSKSAKSGCVDSISLANDSLPVKDRLPSLTTTFAQLVVGVCDRNDAYSLIQSHLESLKVGLKELVKPTTTEVSGCSSGHLGEHVVERTLKVKEPMIKSKRRLKSGVELNQEKMKKKKGRSKNNETQQFMQFM